MSWSALLSQQGLGFENSVQSDCKALTQAVQRLLNAVPETRVCRDATRGGCAAVINEIAINSKVTVNLDQNLSLNPWVKGACQF